MGKYKKLFLIIFISFIPLFFISCQLNEDEKKAIDEAIGSPPQPPPQNDHTDDEGSSCFTDAFYQPPAEITKKVDILFVTDTSGSLNEERPLIASEIDAFVNELPLDTDYQIAVMLAHGSRGPGSGKLWKTKNEPYVLSSLEMSQSEIRQHLIEKLQKVKSDIHSDGGEEGLYSINRALRQGLLDRNSAHGFFREDAALAVVFIADENDICARYPEGVKRVYDPDKLELPAFDRDCTDITPQIVLENLKELQAHRPLLVSGILYNENSIFPQAGENEIGYGYLELIKQAGGISIDLSGNHFHEGLKTIGSLLNKKLNLRTEFKLTHTNIDSVNMSVLIDGHSVNFDYLPELGEVHLLSDAGKENSEIKISYCEKVESILDPVEEPIEILPPDQNEIDPSVIGEEPNDEFIEPVDEDGDGIDDNTGTVIL